MSLPLQGVVVLELATGIAGPYAGRLLAMLGAEVVKLEPSWGDPARRTPVDDEAGPGHLYAHLSADKRSEPRSPRGVRELLGGVHAVIDDRTRYQIDETELAPEILRATHPGLVFASVTAWGFESLEPGRIPDELLVQARSGAMTVTGDPEGPPLRFPGWQAQYFAGAYSAAAILACLVADDGAFHHVDVSWLGAMASATEAGLSRALQTGRDLPPAGPRSLRTFPSGAWPCADGHVVPGTVRRKDWEAQCELYGMPDLARDDRFKAAALRGQNHAELEAILRPWYASREKRAIFEDALPRGLALGMVLTGRDVLSDPHLKARGFLSDQDGTALPGRLAVWTSHAGPASTPPAARISSRSRHDAHALLSGVRVLELCTAWAGPFIGRFLGAFGADVVKVESARQPDGWRTPMPLSAGLRAVPDGIDGSVISNDVAPNFNSLNRNKRGISLDLTTAKGREIALRLVAQCDVVTCNFTARVLPNLGLDDAALREVNPGLILLSMPALGASGPYRDAAGYGTIVEGMGGFASRFGHRHEQARVSDTYYPDAVAGVHATVAVLAALERRRRTGEGAFIDLSQQEVLWLQLGEGIALASTEGRDPGRLGNGEPGCAGSGVFPTVDGRWVAIVARDGEELAALREFVGDRLDTGRDAAETAIAAFTSDRRLADLEDGLGSAGIGVAPVVTYTHVPQDPWIAHLQAIETVVHPVTGPTESLRIPVRIDFSRLDSLRPSPRFDEHTDELLAELCGLSGREVDALRQSGAIGGRPPEPTPRPGRPS